MLVALLPFTFISCDEDDEIAYTLEGTWKEIGRASCRERV